MIYVHRTINRQINQEYTQKKLIDIMNQISDLQYKLYADKGKGLLIILQGTDTSGKDSTIRHVMSAFNPQSCRAISFKAPNNEELSHDYLWRAHKNIPAKGQITIFNRSYYEDVIEVLVHKMISKNTCHERYQHLKNDSRTQPNSGNSLIMISLSADIGIGM